MAVQSITFAVQQAHPRHVTGDQIRAVVAALGIDMIEFETIMAIHIDPSVVAVTTMRRNTDGYFHVVDDELAVDTHVLGVRWG